MRALTKQEIEKLTASGCTAENWAGIQVADSFDVTCVRQVSFFGNVVIGENSGSITVSDNFKKPCGIYNATLRNVSIGDNCLVENVKGFIDNYEIGDNCLISHIYSMETTDRPHFGEGRLIPVLNEAGDGNVMIFEGLTSQLAAIQVKYEEDKEVTRSIHELICKDIAERLGSDPIGKVASEVHIQNVGRIVDTRIGTGCRVDGAQLLKSCTISDNVTVGTGVIAEECVVCRSSEISKNANLEGCFIGEATTVTNGFSAEHSIFFANSFMGNGEACAAFCGPFTVSHHKGSLLIGSDFSFYNAGSATNFSNHAYKMGPLHWGVLERGSKTASGSHLLLPAHIGAFSVCLGKLINHPDTRNLPFSYLIADGNDMLLVPGKNIVTVGLYRDVNKWPHRDKRKGSAKASIINFDWLSPYTISKVIQAKKMLEDLLVTTEDQERYSFMGGIVKRSSLEKGIQYYDLAIRLYLGSVISSHESNLPKQQTGAGDWSDLSGLLLPKTEEERLVHAIRQGAYQSVQTLVEDFEQVHTNYNEFRWTWTYPLLCSYYQSEGGLTSEKVAEIEQDYKEARKTWISEIRKDAEREFKLGDVTVETYQNFIQSLEKELKAI
ncbi:MAG: DUF4954 family protein [Bacteroidales bacterium]|nr:DUF4954 family protein [Bacteroidales bacterium]